MKEQTRIRHEKLRKRMDDLSEQYKQQGVRDFARQAIMQVQEETGYSYIRLYDIRYFRNCD